MDAPSPPLTRVAFFPTGPEPSGFLDTRAWAVRCSNPRVGACRASGGGPLGAVVQIPPKSGRLLPIGQTSGPTKNRRLTPAEFEARAVRGDRGRYSVRDRHLAMFVAWAHASAHGVVAEELASVDEWKAILEALR